MMLSQNGFSILEAALRSLLMAAAVWGAIRLLRVQAVMAQKLAWAMVLVGAGIMPLIMHTPWLALDSALRIPIRAFARGEQPAVQALVAPSISRPADTAEQRRVRAYKSSHEPSHGSLPVRTHVAVSRAVKVLAVADASSSSASKPISISVVPMAGQSTATSAPKQSDGQPNFGWGWAKFERILAFLYIAVGGLLLLRILAGSIMAFRLWQRSEPVESFENGGRSAFEEHSQLAQNIRISRDLSTPVTIGSTVILPADSADWDEAKLRIVLAHEQSHVRQGDFYLQLVAAVHAAVFWFSPLGWWLQRKLTELGETLSDRAGLEQAPNPAAYAQILLEFAAMPRPHPLSRPIPGVAMARRKHLSSRIERILNTRSFGVAFAGSRSHAVVAAALVPFALLAAVACIRIVPTVEAAQSATTITAQSIGQGTGTATAQTISAQATGLAVANATTLSTGQATGQVSSQAPDQVTTVDSGQSAPPAPAVAPVAPAAPAPDIEPDPAPEPAPVPSINVDIAPVAPAPPAPRHGRSYVYSNDDEDGDSFAIVRGGHDTTASMNGHSGEELEKARQKVHGDFIWFEHDGKSYVVTDPAILAQSQVLFKGDDALERRMAELDRQQAELNKKMEAMQPEMQKAGLPGPEFEAQMAKLHEQLAKLQTTKLADGINKQISQEQLNEMLGNLQEKIGDIQGQIGEIQGKIGERQGEIGEKQGELGEQMGRIGEQMGQIGEQQGKMAEEASRKLKSILDQTIQNGKAKPVD
jgi:beta-lactamase regulating signal transducer with metallopeptidase domain